MVKARPPEARAPCWHLPRGRTAPMAIAPPRRHPAFQRVISQPRYAPPSRKCIADTWHISTESAVTWSWCAVSPPPQA